MDADGEIRRGGGESAVPQLRLRTGVGEYNRRAGFPQLREDCWQKTQPKVSGPWKRGFGIGKQTFDLHSLRNTALHDFHRCGRAVLCPPAEHLRRFLYIPERGGEAPHPQARCGTAQARERQCGEDAAL